jgi:menaquinone-dependent protoporphyrinogen oxidase
VWLFSVGVGPSLRGPIGQWLGDEVPPRIEELLDALRLRGCRAFTGVVPRTGTSPLFRVLLGCAAAGPVTSGTWAAIDVWAVTVAEELRLIRQPH